MPLVCLVCGMYAGLLSVSAHAHLPAEWGLALGLAASLGALSFQRPTVFLACITLAAAGWAHALVPKQVDGAALSSGLATLRLEVERTACGERCWAEATVERCEPMDPGSCPPPGSRIAVSTSEELPPHGRVTLLAAVANRTGFRNPTPAAQWPDTRPGFRARAKDAASVRWDEVSWLSRLLLWARGAAREALSASLREPHAGIARALLLGEGNAVPDEINDAIRNAGVSHVLAVSGMHVTVLAGALVLAVRWLWLRSPLALLFEASRAAAGLGVLLAPLVALLCGGSPSALRAGLTSALMYGLTALGRRPGALPVSAFAVLIYAVLDPREAFHPGFVLSVLATGALLTGPRGHGSALLGAARESLRAWISTAPFLALCFGTTSLIALAANVVLLPLGGLLIPLAVAALVTAMTGVASSLGVRWAFETASGAFLEASKLCSALDPGFQIPPLSPTQSLCVSLIAAIWLSHWPRGLRVQICSAALLIAGASEWHLRHALSERELRVTFLDVGQGDAALIESGRGEVALIDAGGAMHGEPDPGREAIVPLLRAMRVDHLDLVVLTHPHPDHYGGLAAVFDAFQVRELWDTGQAEAEQPEGAVTRLLARARASGTRVRKPADLCGAPRAMGGAMLEVFAPCPGFDEGFEPNDNSFVIRLSHGARSVLFTGDAERAEEAALMAHGGLQSDVLKVGHHGSRTSSGEAFFRAVAPALAVVSAGRGNRFGHPHAEVLDRLARGAKHVLRTDRVGGIRVVSDGTRLRVDAWAPEVNLNL